MMNKVVAGMDSYKVVIGSEIFEIEAEDNLRAKYEAAVLFKEMFELDTTLGRIVRHALARVVTSPQQFETTREVLKSLEKED